MTPVFADTLFYVALLNRRDEHHATALKWASQERPAVVTTEFVLLEVANFSNSHRIEGDSRLSCKALRKIRRPRLFVATRSGSDEVSITFRRDSIRNGR